MSMLHAMPQRWLWPLQTRHVGKQRCKPDNLRHFSKGSKKPYIFRLSLFSLQKTTRLKVAFDAAERNGKFGRIQCQRSKESSNRGKRKRAVFLCIKAVESK